MNLLLSAYPGDEAVLVILIVLAQTTVVATLALALGRMFARNAAVRHFVLLTALVCVALGVFVTLALDRADIALVRLPWPSAEVDQPAPGRFIVEVVDVGDRVVEADLTTIPHEAEAVGRPRAKPTAAPSARSVLRSVGAAALMLWLLGALGLLLRMVASWRAIAALRRGVVPIDPANLGSMADRIRRRFGLTRLPAVAVTAHVTGPCSVGVFRPLILLPTGFLDQFAPAPIEAVLMHETAHVARRDCAVALFQGIIGALFWPHPLIHLVNRRLRRAREELCDNHVVESIGRAAYGRILLEVGEVLSGMRPAADAIGMFGRDWKLEDRIRGLLDSRRRMMTRMTLPAALLVVAAFSILTIAIAGAEPKGEKDENRSVNAALWKAELARHYDGANSLKKRKRDELNAIEGSAVPKSDLDPITYPDAAEWKELTAKRQKYKDVDLKVKTEKTQEIERSLNLPVTFEFQDVPLADVASFLQDYTNVNVVLDPVGLAAAGLDSDTPVTSTLLDVRLGLALRALLEPLGLTFVVRDEVLLITDVPSTEDEWKTRVYPVADLVTVVTGKEGPPGLKASEADADSAPLIDLIMSVEPDTWELDGGEGTIEYFPPNRSLVIRQTSTVHKTIANLLMGLRRLQDRPISGLRTYFIEVPADEKMLSVEMTSELFPRGDENLAVIDGGKLGVLITICQAAKRVSISAGPAKPLVDRRPIAIGKKDTDSVLLIVPQVSDPPAVAADRSSKSVRLHLSCLSRKLGFALKGTEETIDVRLGDWAVYELRSQQAKVASSEGLSPKGRKRTFVLISPTD